MKKKIIHFLKKPLVAITISVLALAGATAYAVNHLKVKTPSADIVVARGDITEKTLLSGTVVSKNHADLSFATSGRIQAVYHASGEYVAQGALIVSLDTSDLEARRVDAQAGLMIEQSKLADMQAGIDTGFDRSRTELFNSAEDAYAKADDAVHNYADYFYANPTSQPDFGVMVKSDGATLSFQAKTYDQKTALDAERASIETMLVDWQSKRATASADPIAFAELSKTNLGLVRNFLNDVALQVDSFSVTDLTYQGIIDSFKGKISTARSSISTALSALVAAQNVLPNESARSIQQAQISRAQAAVDGIDAEIVKAEIRAPFSGVLAKNDAQSGEIAIPNVPVATIIAQGYTIDAYASEADVANIKPGSIAVITLDAYGAKDPFAGTVATVDKSQTTQNGVGAYKISIALGDSTVTVADGMHANISIATATKHDVLRVPARALVRRGDTTVVLVKTNGVAVERSVTTGVTDGESTEILSGLSEGEHIISFGK